MNRYLYNYPGQKAGTSVNFLLEYNYDYHHGPGGPYFAFANSKFHLKFPNYETARTGMISKKKVLTKSFLFRNCLPR